MESYHYIYERSERERVIQEVIGMGEVVYTTIQRDPKKNRDYKYEITSTGILTVWALDKNYVVTRMIARPNRLKQYWADCPNEIIMLAVSHCRAGYVNL